MRHAAWLALALVWGAWTPSASRASAAPAPLLRYAGAWTFSANAPGGPACEMRLRTGRIGRGYRIDVPRACMGVFADAIDIKAWRPVAGDMVSLTSRSGRQVLVFRPTGAGAYLARGERGAFVLARGSRLSPALRWGPIGGRWLLKRFGGEQLCDLTLRADGTGLAGRIEREGACAPASWSFSRERLTLKDSGGTALYRFRRGDVTTFQGASPQARGLFMVRPSPPLLEGGAGG
jgi:hypothetical protein